MITIRDLTIYAEGGEFPIIEDMSLEISRGESVAIIGPSGCGKTTLLHALAGLRELTSGVIKFDRGRGERALILQDIGLLPWKTVWENAILGLELRGKSSEEKDVRGLMNELGIADLRDRFPSQLSGGQKRRLGLVRALAVEPDVLLMDEPLVSLDEFTREKLQNIILSLWRENQLTMVMVTHDIEEAVFLGERIATLTDRPATVQQIISNDWMGSVEYRRSSRFYEIVKKLREVIS